MRKDGVTDPVGAEVAREEDDRVGVHRQVTEPGVDHLQEGVEHVLDRACALGELIEHDGNGLALVQTKAGVGVVLGRLGVVIDHRHCNVPQIEVRHVDVHGRQAGQLANGAQDAGLADAGFALQQEAVATHGSDEGCRLGKSDGGGMRNDGFSHDS